MTQVHQSPKGKKLAVIHAHPHFLSPGKRSEAPLDERFYRSISPVPGLPEIVHHALRNDIGILAISACHPAPGHIDNRFHEYMSQLPSLVNSPLDILKMTNLSEGWVPIVRRDSSKENSRVVIIYSQQVRADYEGKAVDINVIGTSRDIPAGMPLEKTLAMAAGYGAFAIVCHPGSGNSSLGLEKTIELIKEGKALTAEGIDASMPKEYNEKARDALEKAGIRNWVAVPNSHHYSENATAGMYVSQDLVDNFSIDALRETIYNGNFSVKEGSLPALSKFTRVGLPIILSRIRHKTTTAGRKYLRWTGESK